MQIKLVVSFTSVDVLLLRYALDFVFCERGISNLIRLLAVDAKLGSGESPNSEPFG